MIGKKMSTTKWIMDPTHSEGSFKIFANIRLVKQ